MGNEGAIVYSGIAPHPPIMVPEVGGAAIVEVRASIDAMAEFTRRVIESGAGTVVLVSPHAPLARNGFVAYEAPTLYGDFADFRAPATKVEFQLDRQLLSEIRNTAAQDNYALLPIEKRDLDHGAMVPLYFLQRGGWSGQVIALGYSFLSNEEHLEFGACIKRAVDQLDRAVALIASGDLSHRLKPNAPAGYYPGAYAFDDQVVGALQRNVPDEIIDIDQDLRRAAGECGYRSMLVILGAIQNVPAAAEVLNYEAPFGVGYLVAQLTNSRAPIGDTTVESSHEEEQQLLAELLPSLARQAVESFVNTGRAPNAPESYGPLSARAACFVSIKTRAGDLRGCIGTIEPVKQTLAEEVVMNAINAASRDPRFMPIEPNELEGLYYSVDILGAAEPTTMEGLDPAVYGVIVEDEDGNRRGLLLPAIEGVDTAATQVQIAARKAGIPLGTPLKLERFKVQRFREQELTPDNPVVLHI